MSGSNENISGSGLTVVKAEGPKFKLRAMYDDLNDTQKRIVRMQYHGRFGGNVPTFYNKLLTDNLLADELVFFADIFDCKVMDLYNRPPLHQPSVLELFRKARGYKLGKQAGLDV